MFDLPRAASSFQEQSVVWGCALSALVHEDPDGLEQVRAKIFNLVIWVCLSYSSLQVEPHQLLSVVNSDLGECFAAKYKDHVDLVILSETIMTTIRFSEPILEACKTKVDETVHSSRWLNLYCVQLMHQNCFHHIVHYIFLQCSGDLRDNSAKRVCVFRFELENSFYSYISYNVQLHEQKIWKW